MRWRRWTGCAPLVAAMACGSASRDPQPLPLDRVDCARCGMLISDPAHAAQALVPNEEPRFYDDRGCLASDAASLPAGAGLYVQLDGGAAWIDARTAYFAFPAHARTPMGYNVTAFRTGTEAAAADRSGRALRWPDVVREVAARPRGVLP